MSIDFIKPSTVIKRLITARAHISKTSNDFKIWGAGEFDKASASSYFAKDSSGFRVPVLIIAVGNNTGSIEHIQGAGSSDLTHTIDVHYIAPLKDRRGQFRDEESVWVKQFVVQALHCFEPSSGANPLNYTGDNLTQIAGVAGYSRTYTFAQSMLVDQDDTWGGDEDSIIGADDLYDFETISSETFADAPPIGDISPASNLDIDLR